MKKTKSSNKYFLIAVIVINLSLIISVVYLMNHVKDLLNNDVQTNLTEIVTQNKDVITSRLNLEINNLKTIANNISDKATQSNNSDFSFLKETFKKQTTEKDNEVLAIANKEGEAYYPTGAKVDISGRQYFKLAIQGEQNVSEKIISRLNGEDLYVITTPIYYNGTIVGTLQKGYSAEEIYQICSVSLFSDKGIMYIIKSDGYIVINTQQDNYIQPSDNYVRDLYETGNTEASVQLQEDLLSNKNGFFESTINGEKLFSAYTPINGIHDWFLVTSVPVNAVSSNSGIVVNLFYFILFFVVIILTLSCLYFSWYKTKQQKTLKKIAFVDPITGGNTYNKFEIEVTTALSDHPNQNFYILKFDIDNFKYINNYYGFDFGDQVLQQIYQHISNKLVNHELIARITGDQFVVLLEDASEVKIKKLLDDIQIINSQISVYCSAGIYHVKDHNENISLMIDKARTAAQTVKGILNKKYAYYEDRFDQSAAHAEQLKRAVLQAIENDEFIVFYQPKVDVDTRKLVGSEALVRWLSNGKIIPPLDFIPMCEKSGIICSIDLIVFEKVLQFLKRNLDEGNECTPISINFSRLHLNDPDFIHTISNKLEKYNVPPHLVEIELTESAFFDNIEAIQSFTNKLHKYGFKMAMDDFGSGYSSLNMLKDVSIDTLKIDKDFLSTEKNEIRRDIIFSSIVDMAQKLNIAVVVEGVETIENVNLMQKCKCSVAQGYYFSKPMPQHDFVKIYKEKKL
ncbi:MAG: GGDEF domain-containing protein [Coprobacillus sp.]